MHPTCATGLANRVRPLATLAMHAILMTRAMQRLSSGGPVCRVDESHW
jgi:hypothetical protein